MAIKKHKPTSPGRRFATWLQHDAVTKDEPEKALTEGLTKSGGRNKHGRVTSRHRGGGAKRRGLSSGTRRRWKKAVVTLHPEDTIELFEGQSIE